MKKARTPADQPIMQQEAYPVFDLLAEALHMMSLSLVKIVLTYTAYPPPAAGTTPNRLLSFGSKGDKDGQFTWPCYGVVRTPDGNFIVTGANKVQVFDENGLFLYHAARGWKGACGITLANRLVYIVDHADSAVSVCRLDGSVVRRIGSHGKGDGQLEGPFYAAVADQLFVTDGNNSRITIWTLEGGFVSAFGSNGTGPGQFDVPRGIALSSAGELAIVDGHNNRVQVFDRNGKFLRQFGSKGSENSQLNNPFGMTVNSADQWLICDCNNHLLKVFSADGSFVTAFGYETASPPRTFEPRGVSVDDEGCILVASSAQRVHVFGFEWPAFGF